MRAHNQFLTAQDSADPDLRPVLLTKTSSDDYFDVDGITFQLIDANGAGKVLATGVVQQGQVLFANVNVGTVVPPLIAHELPPSNGLDVAPDTVLPWPLSTDLNNPSGAAILDLPIGPSTPSSQAIEPAPPRGRMTDRGSCFR